MRSARAVTVAAAVAALTLAGCAGDEGGGAAPAPAASAPAPATTPAAGGTPTPKTTTAVTGGGDALRAFDGKVTYKRRTGSGWVVFFTESAADGQVLEATIVPVRLA
jgi:hypothetical protein